MAWVSEFFTKNPNLKKKRKKNKYFFSVFGGWGRISEFFYKESKSKHFLGWGWGV